MKRIASLLICAVMLFACIPFVNAAEDITVISGNYSLVCEDADKIIIGDTVIKPEEDFEFEIRVTVSGAESKHNLFLLNGTPVGVISEGVNTLKFRISQLAEGKNSLGVRLGTSEEPFDFSMVYGTVNLDDLKIVSVEFVDVTGEPLNLSYTANVQIDDKTCSLLFASTSDVSESLCSIENIDYFDLEEYETLDSSFIVADYYCRNNTDKFFDCLNAAFGFADESLDGGYDILYKKQGRTSDSDANWKRLERLAKKLSGSAS